MANAGSSLMGIGTAAGKTMARNAALNAIQSPMLDNCIEGHWNRVDHHWGSDLTLYENYSRSKWWMIWGYTTSDG
ncbi:unnamed protein product [Rhodiola kirilowii]